ncbi:MAG: phytanoyl-CoA dioxygenase family protein [Pseudomonadales bacterium]|nr:phytanoyl-CoA dioxygenase family protein [Pseudomonadales bacterium]
MQTDSSTRDRTANENTQLDQYLSQLAVDGYTVIEQLIPEQLVQRIRSELDPYLQKKKMGRNNFEGEHSERVYALLAKSHAMAEIIEHETILAILDRLLPNNYLLSAALAINVHPGETPQPFHIDDGAGGLGLPRPRQAYGISTIWAFDDFTADNGATEVVPGSHHWPDDREPQESEIVKVTMPAGSVVVFQGTLLHRGGANNSQDIRLGITPQYCAPGLRQIENMVLAVPPEKARYYSDKIQNMLGYNIIDPGFMGYVDGQHPKKVINPDYQGRKYRAELPAP